LSDVPRDIVFTRYEASRGLAWLRSAAAMFAQARARWLLLLFAYYVILATLRTIPFAGVVAVSILKPVLGVGFLAAAWTVERGGRPQLRHIGQGFRSNLRALLPIGVVFALGLFVAVLASALVDHGKLIDFLTNPPPAPATGDTATTGDAAVDDTEAVLMDANVELGMLFAAICALPVLLAVWFAPALVVFQDLRASQAMLTSLRAAVANWRPIAVYALALFVIAGMMPTLIVTLLSLLLSGFPQAVRGVVTLGVLLPYIAMVAAIVQIADYTSYRDVFHAGETLAPLSRH
jgi:uncharacterized membrane protein